jgi:glycerol kinase
MARILAIDAGTTGVRAIVFAGDGARLASAYREIVIRYPRPGWAEQDLGELWAKTQAVMSEAMSRAGMYPSAFDGIAITNQRSSVAAWDARHLQPLSPLISWQDVRAADRANVLRASGFFVTPNVSVSKAEWIVRNTPAASDAAVTRTLRLGGTEAWLVANLTGGAHLCDHANASATGFYEHRLESWDPGLLDAVGISSDCMPQVVDCQGRLALTDSDVFGAAVPIAGLCGDQQASLYGAHCETRGATKCSYGTSAMVDAWSGAALAIGSPGTYPLVAWRLNGDEGPTWCVEGSVITAGAAVQWLRDGLGLIRHAAEIGELAAGASDSGGVWVVPALQGLGTPFAESRARGIVGGLSRSSAAPQIARALLEGIAHRVCDVAEAVWAATGRPSELRADGGASRNDLLLQLQADFLGLPVERAFEPDGSAFGVARMASRGLEMEEAVRGASAWRAQHRFEPRISDDARDTARIVWSRRVALAARAED